MRKIYFALFAMLISFAANAADWYISGAFQGWSHCKAGYQLVETAAGSGIFKATFTEAISGEFLICQGTLNTPDWNNKLGTNGSKVVEGQAYKYVKGANNFNMDGSVSNPTVTLDTNAGTLLISGQAQENQYDVVYVVGQINDDNWDDSRTDYPMTLKSGTDDVWTTKLTINSTTYFKLRAGNNQYGVNGGNDITPVLGQSYTAQAGDKSFKLNAGSYTLTFTLPYNAETGTLVVTSDEPVSYPEKLYIVGYVNNKDFAPNNTVEMSNEGDGIYTAEDVLLGDSLESGYGYFQFATATGSSADDWSGLGTRYGAETADFIVTLDEPMNLTNNDMSFKAAANVKYSFTVNLDEMTVTVTSEGGDNPPVPDTPSFGLVGTIMEQGWDIDNPIAMTEEDGTWTYTADELAAGTLFKIATVGKGWDDTYGAEGDLNQTAAADIAVTVGTPMNAWSGSSNNFMIEKALKDVTITFVYNETAGEASTLTVTGTEENEEPPVDVDGTYDFNSIFNSWDASEITADGNNKYINVKGVTLTENDFSFVANQAGSSQVRIYKSGSDDAQLRLGKATNNMGTITITAPNNYGLKSIELATSTGKGAYIDGWAFGSETEYPKAESKWISSDTKDSSNYVIARTFTTTEDNIKEAVLNYTGSGTTKISTVKVTAKNTTTGVETVIEFNVDGPVEYYNMQGVRVANPEKGIYIVRQGNKTKKVIL